MSNSSKHKRNLSAAEPESTTGLGHNSEAEAKHQYVTKFNKFRKDRGEAWVRQCVLVLEAENELTLPIYEEFLQEVGLPRRSSNFRKARTVAQAANRLLAISDRLPDSRSTIYELAILDEATFAALVEDGLTPSTTADQVRKRESKTRPEGNSERCVVPVDATPLSIGERVALIKALREVASRAGATVRVPKSIKAIESMEERA